MRVRKNFMDIAYAGYITNDEIRMKSSSGGMFSAFTQEILKDDNGVVYGICEFEDKLTFIRATSWDLVEKMRGSKYYQADTTTLNVELLLKDIKEKKRVLIIGTSCQIGMFYAVIKSFFKEIPNNIILIGLICHGVGSKKYIDRYRKEIERKNKKKLIMHSFRNKKNDRISSNFSKYIYMDNTIIECENEKDYYMRCFYGDFILRPSCYNCSYAGNKGYADILIGDFNGSERVIKNYPDSVKSISSIIVKTEKGKKFLEAVSNNGLCKLKKTSFDLIAEQNLPLRFPSKKPIIRKYMFYLIDKIGFINAVKIVTIKYYIKLIILSIGGEKILKVVKKIFKRKTIIQH